MLTFSDEMFPNRCDLYLAGSGSAGPGPMGTRNRNLPADPNATAIPCSWQEATEEDVVEFQAKGVTVSHNVFIRVSDLEDAGILSDGDRVNEAIPNDSKLVVDGEVLLVSRCRDEGGLRILARVACRERA